MNNNTLDIDLVNGCVNNNRQAQEKLYKRFYAPMLSICLRYTRNEADAIEALHNGFLKVYKNIHLFDCSKAGLYTWIKKVMVNSAIDFARQYYKHAAAAELGGAEEPFVDSEALLKLDATELLHYIRQLPTATQTVFNLYVVEGFTHKEIGIKMGISEGTSKWHLSEARKTLKQSLQTSSVV